VGVPFAGPLKQSELVGIEIELAAPKLGGEFGSPRAVVGISHFVDPL